MYTSEKSTKLTLYITYTLMVLLGILTVVAIPGARWFFGSFVLERTIKTILVVFYLSCPAGWLALIFIMKILKNILSRDVFTDKTVNYLRYSS